MIETYAVLFMIAGICGVLIYGVLLSTGAFRKSDSP